MKSLRILAVAVTGLLSILPADLFAVPKVVEENFESKYTDATDVEWEVDAHGYWEADFRLHDEKLRADYLETGEWIETEMSIKFGDLPDAVQKSIREEFEDQEITEIERVEHGTRGLFFDVEFKRQGKNQDIEYLENGEKAPAEEITLDNATDILFEPIPELNTAAMKPQEIGRLELMMEFGLNLIVIFLYSYVIYYRRHHDHKMLFLLLGFNLFLFPIFLLNSVLTAGIGFTIFALLALVRLRSDTFDKAEVAYLLGAVALTFINSVLPARVEYVSAILVLATAYFGDHPKLWRDAYQTVQIRLPLSDMRKMLNSEYLKERLEKEFEVIVNDVEIIRVEKKKVHLRVMYRSKPLEDDPFKEKDQKG